MEPVLADLRGRIEEALEEADAEERAANLDALHRELRRLVRETEEQLEHARREATFVVSEELMMARENADLREELLSQGWATSEQLDEWGFLSHEAIDLLDDQGRLEEGIRGALGQAFGLGLLRGQAFNMKVNRGQGGKFEDKPDLVGKIPQGRKSVAAERPIRVKREARRFRKDKLHYAYKTPQVRASDEKSKIKRVPLKGQKKSPPHGMSGAQEQHLLAKEKEKARRSAADTLKGKSGETKTYAERSAELDKKTGEAIAQGVRAKRESGYKGRINQNMLLDYVRGAVSQPSTSDLYRDPETGDYDESRRRLHDWIIDRMLRKQTWNAEKGEWEYSVDNEELPSQDEPEVVMIGGGYAAGKSSTIGIMQAQGLVPGDAVNLDADEIKAMLPEFSLLREDDPEANLLVYEEAVHIAEELQRRAQERKVNVVVSGILDTSGEDVMNRVRGYRDKGYTPHIGYVTIPTDEAARRSAKRAMESDKPQNRRHIPEPILRTIHRDVSHTVVELSGVLREEGIPMDVYDNNTAKGSPPVKIASLDESGLEVLDRDRWDAFLAKGDEPVPGVDDVGPEGILAKLKAQIEKRRHEHAERNIDAWPPVKGKLAKRIFDTDIIEYAKRLQQRGQEPHGAATTEHLHKTDPGDGSKLDDWPWNEERVRAVHDPIIEFFLDAHQPKPEGQREMLAMGGGTAAGKSSFINMEVIQKEMDAVLIDPDAIKNRLPEFREMLSLNPDPDSEDKKSHGPRDPYAAYGVHEESSAIAKRLMQIAQERGINIILDGTADGTDPPEGQPSSIGKKLLKAHDAGYEIDMKYADAPIPVSQDRALIRGRQTGRYVPPASVEAMHIGASKRFREVVGYDFIRSIEVYNTNFPQGEPAQMTARLSDAPQHTVEGMERMDILEPIAFDRFASKADKKARVQP